MGPAQEGNRAVDNVTSDRAYDDMDEVQEVLML